MRCDECGVDAPALKTCRRHTGEHTFVLCDACWLPISDAVWVVPGLIAVFGSCRRCGSWFSLRELRECTGGGKSGAPSGLCWSCAGGGVA